MCEEQHKHIREQGNLNAAQEITQKEGMGTQEKVRDESTRGEQVHTKQANGALSFSLPNRGFKEKLAILQSGHPSQL